MKNIGEKEMKDLKEALEKAFKPFIALIHNAMKAFENLSTDLSNLNQYKIVTGCRSDYYYRRDWELCEKLSKLGDNSPQQIFNTLLDLYKFGASGDDIEVFLSFLIQTNRI